MPASRPPFFSHSTNRYFSSLLIAILLSALSNAVFPPALFASNNPVPYIDLVAPVSIHPGTTSVTLTVLGTGFISTSVVKWNSTSLTTTFVSSKKLTAAVPDSMVAAVGLGSITVVSPTPGGGASNVYYVPVASQESSTTFPSTPSSSITVGNTPRELPPPISTATATWILLSPTMETIPSPSCSVRATGLLRPSPLPRLAMAPIGWPLVISMKMAFPIWPLPM